ncbi:MAG: helicase, partial [Azoarcus sp.]|nr:helicase [Azoarcus sp.]
FYKHVEAQSVTPFSPRAMDRGLTGALLSLMRLENEAFSPNEGADELDKSDKPEITEAIGVLVKRARNVSGNPMKELAERELKERADEWAKEVSIPGRTLGYEKRGTQAATMVKLISPPGIEAWDNWTVPMSMREVEPGVRLIMNTVHISDEREWKVRPVPRDGD